MWTTMCINGKSGEKLASGLNEIEFTQRLDAQRHYFVCVSIFNTGVIFRVAECALFETTRAWYWGSYRLCWHGKVQV